MLNEKEAEAIELIKKSGEDFEKVSQITGFNSGKLYQWFKTERFPSLKVAKKICKHLGGGYVERKEKS